MEVSKNKAFVNKKEAIHILAWNIISVTLSNVHWNPDFSNLLGGEANWFKELLGVE